MLKATMYLKTIFTISMVLQQSKAEVGFLLSTITYFDRRYIENFRLDIHPGNQSFDLLLMPKDQPYDAWFEIIIEIKNRRSNKYRQLFRSLQINYCELTRHSGWFNDFLIYIIKLGGANLTECPLKKAKYFWRNISAANSPVPVSSLLIGSYRGQLLGSFKKGKQLISNLTAFGVIK